MILHLTLCIVNVRYKCALMGWGGGGLSYSVEWVSFFRRGILSLHIYVGEHTPCLYQL